MMCGAVDILLPLGGDSKPIFLYPIPLLTLISIFLGFEIPDQDAEHLLTPALIVQYIMDKFDVLDDAIPTS